MLATMKKDTSYRSSTMSDIEEKPQEAPTEAMLLIPGTDFEVYEEFLEDFIKGMKSSGENPFLTVEGTAQVADINGRRVSVGRLQSASTLSQQMRPRGS
jgi:hypothetical protein